jgi:hypothetical protein
MSPAARRAATALTYAVPSIVAVGWYGALGGWHTLVPTNTWWMLDGDWFGYLYSWLFYRNAPWSLPFGDVPDLIHPYGVTLALTDALPLVSTVAKVFSPVLPAQFQLYGLWMCSGFVGMGVVGVRFAARVTDDRVVQALAGSILAVSPILSQRYGHPPFYALWAVFGLVGLSVVPSKRPWRDQWAAWAFLFLAASTNAYLAVMSLGLAYAVAARAVLARSFRGRQVALALAGPAVSAFAAFWLFGYLGSFGRVQGEAEGFGQFSADLLTFINPTNWSRLFGGFRTGPRQYEGYAYLGLGVLLLFVPALAWTIRVRPSRQRLLGLVPVTLVALGFFAWSLSNVVTFSGQMVVDLRPLYAKLGTLPSVFRSSGRFAWPMHALLVLSVLAAVVHLATRRRRLGRVLLGVALVAQLGDLDTKASTLGQVKGRFVPFQSAVWKSVGRDYRHIALIPVQISWYSPFDQDWVAKLSWEAYSQHLSINSGYIGRAPKGLVWDKHLEPGELDSQTVYVVYFREYLPDFQAQGWACGPLERMVVCVDPSRRTPLLEALEANRRAGQTAVLRPLH